MFAHFHQNISKDIEEQGKKEGLTDAQIGERIHDFCIKKVNEQNEMKDLVDEALVIIEDTPDAYERKLDDVLWLIRVRIELEEYKHLEHYSPLQGENGKYVLQNDMDKQWLIDRIRRVLEE